MILCISSLSLELRKRSISQEVLELRVWEKLVPPAPKKLGSRWQRKKRLILSIKKKATAIY